MPRRPRAVGSRTIAGMRSLQQSFEFITEQNNRAGQRSLTRQQARIAELQANQLEAADRRDNELAEFAASLSKQGPNAGAFADGTHGMQMQTGPNLSVPEYNAQMNAQLASRYLPLKERWDRFEMKVAGVEGWTEKPEFMAEYQSIYGETIKFNSFLASAKAADEEKGNQILLKAGLDQGSEAEAKGSRPGAAAVRAIVGRIGAGRVQMELAGGLLATAVMGGHDENKMSAADREIRDTGAQRLQTAKLNRTAAETRAANARTRASDAATRSNNMNTARNYLETIESVSAGLDLTFTEFGNSGFDPGDPDKQSLVTTAGHILFNLRYIEDGAGPAQIVEKFNELGPRVIATEMTRAANDVGFALGGSGEGRGSENKDQERSRRWGGLPEVSGRKALPTAEVTGQMIGFKGAEFVEEWIPNIFDIRNVWGWGKDAAEAWDDIRTGVFLRGKVTEDQYRKYIASGDSGDDAANRIIQAAEEWQKSDGVLASMENIEGSRESIRKSASKISEREMAHVDWLAGARKLGDAVDAARATGGDEDPDKTAVEMDELMSTLNLAKSMSDSAAELQETLGSAFSASGRAVSAATGAFIEGAEAMSRRGNEANEASGMFMGLSPDSARVREAGRQIGGAVRGAPERARKAVDSVRLAEPSARRNRSEKLSFASEPRPGDMYETRTGERLEALTQPGPDGDEARFKSLTEIIGPELTAKKDISSGEEATALIIKTFGSIEDYLEFLELGTAGSDMAKKMIELEEDVDLDILLDEG